MAELVIGFHTRGDGEGEGSSPPRALGSFSFGDLNGLDSEVVMVLIIVIPWKEHLEGGGSPC